MVRPSTLFQVDLRLSSCQWNHLAKPKTATLPCFGGVFRFAVLRGVWHSAFYLSNFFRGESPVTCPHHALNLAGIARTDDGSRNDRQA
jgi:hypothetical protein